MFGLKVPGRFAAGCRTLTGGRVFSVALPAPSVSLYSTAEDPPAALASPAPPCPASPSRSSPDMPANPVTR